MGMGMRIACHALQSGQGAATRKRGSRQDRRPHGAQADLAELRRRLAAAEVAAATNAAAAAAGAAHAAERRRAGGAGGEAGALRRELAAAQAGAQALRCERRQSADAAVALQSQVLELQAGKARSEAAAARLQRALVDLRADKAQQMGAGAAAAAQQERGVAAVVELQARRAAGSAPEGTTGEALQPTAAWSFLHNALFYEAPGLGRTPLSTHPSKQGGYELTTELPPENM